MPGNPETLEQVEGSAATQADLWGDRARDWAEVLEGWSGWGIPIYRHVLDRVAVGTGTKLLDVGCGAGRFCRIAADRGAQVAGLDATAALIEIARERIPDGDLRVGDMELLPWGDDSFDVVTGFNSFFLRRRHGSRVSRGAAGRPPRGERRDHGLRPTGALRVDTRVRFARAAPAFPVG